MKALLVLSALVAGPAFGQSAPEWRTDFSRHTVSLAEIVSGGPPKDGIPAIDHPKFVSVSEGDRWLSDREPVIVVVRGPVAKAYPIQILVWHEIVNDVVGETPVVVTYCPLCNTALAFERRLEKRTLDFGTTGRLRHSDLVMYDRATESWWQQATGEAIVGSYAGTRLPLISAPLVSWKTFKEEYPSGTVLSRETGHRRDYGRNPYARYDDPAGQPMASFFRLAPDRRLPPMERVVAVTLGGAAAAYPFSALARRKVINDRIGDQAVVVVWSPGTASPLDDGEISRGRDVGATAVFRRTLDSRDLAFEPAQDGLVRDRETGSSWNLLGRAVAGPLVGRVLEAVPYGNHFWFAWAAFTPETRIVR